MPPWEWCVSAPQCLEASTAEGRGSTVTQWPGLQGLTCLAVDACGFQEAVSCVTCLWPGLPHNTVAPWQLSAANVSDPEGPK